MPAIRPSPCCFNPRSPHGERQKLSNYLQTRLRVSIHAPHTGSDLFPAQYNLRAREFQSTLPTRGATSIIIIHFSPLALFQSTLPTRGATPLSFICKVPINVSIHAPHTGSDLRHCCLSDISITSFNPRSPHGERPSSGCKGRISVNVSIHAPHTGSDRGFRQLQTRSGVSIHAPHTGSDSWTAAPRR